MDKVLATNKSDMKLLGVFLEKVCTSVCLRTCMSTYCTVPYKHHFTSPRKITILIKVAPHKSTLASVLPETCVHPFSAELQLSFSSWQRRGRCFRTPALMNKRCLYELTNLSDLGRKRSQCSLGCPCSMPTFSPDVSMRGFKAHIQMHTVHTRPHT